MYRYTMLEFSSEAKQHVTVANHVQYCIHHPRIEPLLIKQGLTLLLYVCSSPRIVFTETESEHLSTGSLSSFRTPLRICRPLKIHGVLRSLLALAF